MGITIKIDNMCESFSINTTEGINPSSLHEIGIIELQTLRYSSYSLHYQSGLLEWYYFSWILSCQLVEKRTSSWTGGRWKRKTEKIRSSAERRRRETERNSWLESWEVPEKVKAGQGWWEWGQDQQSGGGATGGDDGGPQWGCCQGLGRKSSGGVGGNYISCDKRLL